MRKLLLTLLLFSSAYVEAQVTDTSAISLKDSTVALPDSLSQEAKDSLMKEVRYLLDILNTPRSFFSFETSIGNRNFSLHNNSFNAQQLSTNKFTLVPTASYIHKSGLGISAAAYMTWEQQPQFFQYAFSPSYDHFGKKFGYGISYTYYITRDDLEFYTTPIKHEFYSYFNSKKGWVRPGFAAGWAAGSFREISRFDTTINGIKRTIIDTSMVDFNGFTLMASLSHVFSWDKIFGKNDNISLVPQFSVIAGTENYSTNSQGKLIIQGLNRRFVKTYRRTDEEHSGFRLNSVAFSLYLTYFNGPLFISPQYFVSYFPGDAEKKFSNIISLSVGVMF